MRAPPPQPDGAEVVVGDGRAVGVELQFVGLSGLIQGFMADARIVARLGNELGPCIASELAVVRATWDSEVRIGTITLELEPADLACLPKVADGSVDVSALEPLNRALANYRDEVSNNYDLRIQSFRTGIKVLSGMNHCALWSGGQYPPDGSTFSRCVDFMGNRHCMPGDQEVGVTTLRFTGEQGSQLAGCFGS